jgi:hypothetical protein
LLSLLCFASCEKECKHDWSDWKVTKEPTCSERGIQSRTCEKCEEREREYIDTVAHTEETVEGREATCQYEGLTEGKRCTVCGTMTLEQQTIPVGAHVEVIEQGYAATCTSRGKTDGKYCSVCYTTLVAQEYI